MDTGGAAIRVDVAGDCAYVANAGPGLQTWPGTQAGLRVISISEPTAPVEVGRFDTPRDANDVAVRGDYAYIADALSWGGSQWEGGGLRVVSVSNPAARVQVGYRDTDAGGLGVYVANPHAYLADGLAGLRVIDVLTATAPVEVGFYNTPGSANDVYVVGDYAHVADGFSGLRVGDVSDPTSPSEVAFYDTRGSADGVYVVGDEVYIADMDGGLVILRFSAEPDLYITKTVTPVHQYPGEGVAYTIVLRNDGGEATVTLSDTLPTEVGLLGAFPPGTYYTETHEYVWHDLLLGMGERITATLLVAVGSEVTPCTWLTNTAYLSYEGMEPLLAQASHHVQPWPELSITKAVEPVEQYPGELVTYTLVLGNDSDQAVRRVWAYDVLPSEVEFASVSGTGVVSYSAILHSPVWSPLTLTTGARVTTTVVVTVGEVASFTTVTNTAYLFYRGMDLLVARVSHYAQPGAPELSITKTVTPVHQYPGEGVAYTIVLGNDGGEATVTLSDTLPTEVGFVWAYPTGTYHAETHEYVWDDLVLGMGERITATLVAAIGADVTPSTWMTNTAYLFYEGMDPLMAQASHHVHPPAKRYVYIPMVSKTYRHLRR